MLARAHFLDVCSAPDVESAELLREAEKSLAETRFSPMGDNHHNAAMCPYCRPKIVEMDEQLRGHKATIEQLQIPRGASEHPLAMMDSAIIAQQAEEIAKLKRSAGTVGVDPIPAFIVRNEALVWYSERAEALARYASEKPPMTNAMMAIVTELVLDAGKRAAGARLNFHFPSTETPDEPSAGDR